MVFTQVNKKVIIHILLTIWIVLWINFILRDLYKKQYFRDYRILARRNSEGKRSYVYSDHFYGLLKFAKEKIPEGSYYDFVGIKDQSIAQRRGIYYLYPSLRQEEKPDFLLIFNIPGYRAEHYDPHAELDKERYILKRRR